MSQKFTIITSVDITPSGVRRKTDDDDWYIKRNQQRNYDTLIQVLSLRCQPLILDYEVLDLPHAKSLKNWNIEQVKLWMLSFETERDDVIGANGELFLQDVAGVPIMTGLTESIPSFPQQFIISGALKNIDIFRRASA